MKLDHATKQNELMKIVELVKKYENVYIQMHNNPDPDALGAGLGIQYLLKEKGIQSILCYYGEISKTNMLKMIELFKIDLFPIKDLKDIHQKRDILILIDCQKGEGNVADLNIENVISIDHHIDLNKTYLYSDIRSNVGACSTIITEYFFENKIEIPKNIAGALLYGINIDTNNLTRGISDLDVDAFYALMNIANPKDIAKINLSQINMEDLKYYSQGLSSVEIYDYIGFADIGECNDALLGTIGDLILSIDGVTVTIVYSVRKDGIKFSFRSMEENIYANELAQYILKGIGAGGGHKEMAGGFLSKENVILLGNKKLDTYIRYKVISFIQKKITT